MSGLTRLGGLALILALAVIVADQTSKHWILEVLRLREGETLAVFGPLHLTGVRNSGVSFGFLQARHDLVRWALAMFSIVVSGVLAVWVRRTERPQMRALLAGVAAGQGAQLPLRTLR